jgi:large subunit ribosomal protein L3
VPGFAGGWISVRDSVKKPAHKDTPVPGKFKAPAAAAAVEASESQGE